MRKVIFTVMVMGVLMVGPAWGSESLIPLEKTAKEMNKRDAARFEQEQGDRQKRSESPGTVREESQTKTPTGAIVYSGLPCKWMRSK